MARHLSDGETVNRVNLNFFAETEVFYVVDTKILPGFEDEKVYRGEVCSEELLLTDQMNLLDA